MPSRLGSVSESIIGRRRRRTREIDKALGTEQPLSSTAPLIFESLEPRLLLAADPLGISAGYAFNEVSGTTTADASANGITGTLVNGPTFTTAGQYGNAVALDGINDYVNLGNPTALQLTGSMTVSAWINASSFPVDDAAIVSKRSSGQIVGFQLDTTVDRGTRTIGFKLTNSSGGQMIRYGATTLQPNTWYYVTGVYNASSQTIDVYLNGQLDNGVLQGTVTASQQNSTANVTIGRRAGSTGFEFSGRIDDVRIANHALTQDQIQTDMVTPLGAAPGPDTVAPSVPTGLVATPVSTTQINLSWNASTDNVGVTGYQVFRNGQQIATTTTTSFSNTGLTPATTYQYAVRASDAAGNTSALTTAVSATTPAARHDRADCCLDSSQRRHAPVGHRRRFCQRLGQYRRSRRAIPAGRCSTGRRGHHHALQRELGHYHCSKRQPCVARARARRRRQLDRFHAAHRHGLQYASGRLRGRLRLQRKRRHHGVRCLGARTDGYTRQRSHLHARQASTAMQWHLDGINDYVNLGNPTALQLTGSMTVSAWINSSSFPVDDAAIVSKRTADAVGFQLDTTDRQGCPDHRLQTHQ